MNQQIRRGAVLGAVALALSAGGAANANAAGPVEFQGADLGRELGVRGSLGRGRRTDPSAIDERGGQAFLAQVLPGK